MAYCGPSCAIPSCASSSVIGFGSAGLGYGSLGALGYGYEAGLGYGYGHGALVGSSVPSASLGVHSGVAPSCINQIPPTEVVIQTPASVVTIPGPVLSASCEPVSVGGNTPCAVAGAGLGGGFYGGLGYGGYGYGYGRGFGYGPFGLRDSKFLAKKSTLG